MGSYVGIDLHRQRSVVVVLDDDGNRVSWSRIDNTPSNLAREVAAAGGRRRGGDGSVLGLVLGRRCDRRVRGDVASGAPVGDRRLSPTGG